MYGKKKRKPIYDASLGEPPTEKQIEGMTAQATRVVEYWLNYRDHSREELRQKIVRKGITDDIADKVLAKYEDLDYINDQRFAEFYAESRIRENKHGKQSVRYQLRQKGVDSEYIEQALSMIDEEDELELAKEIALKKARSNQKLEKQKRLQQIVGLLARRGFSGNVYSIAQEAIQEADSEE